MYAAHLIGDIYKLVTAKYNNKSVLEYQCETIC